MIERPNAVTLGGNPITLLGPELKAGDPAPEFDLVGLDFKPVSSTDYLGQVRIVSWLLSVDTGVCDRQTRRLNSAELPSAVALITASIDTPFALKRYCGAADIRHAVASAYHDPENAIRFGVLQKEWRLPARAVFVIGKDDRIAYAEYVKEVGTEPDYDALIEAARKAAAG
ncbi:MAG: thiol peroxidase [Chloroflexi bacterium]|nr:thiol peroxidase [Chloroflexota bacterium]